MRISRLAAIDKHLKQHAAARKPMQRWIEAVEAAQWQSIAEARRVLPTADLIKGTRLTCFNVGGNNYRLITVVSYELQQVTVIELMTHADYTKKYVR